MRAAVAAIVPAAGAGRRFGGSIKKAFVPLHGVPLLVQTLKVLQASSAIRWIVVVVREGQQAEVVNLVKRHRLTKVLAPCLGGGSRADSVARGFAAVPPEATWILVHDGARPCIRPALIEAAVRAARRHGAVACGLPAMLTVKAVDDRQAVRVTLDRDHLWFVQTPQVFRRDWFAQALERTNSHIAQFPDDAAVLEAAGFPVRMIPGDPLNLKVTTREDLVLAEAILKSRVRQRASCPSIPSVPLRRSAGSRRTSWKRRTNGLTDKTD